MKLLLISLQSNACVTGLKYIAANARANGHDARIGEGERDGFITNHFRDKGSSVIPEIPNIEIYARALQELT